MLLRLALGMEKRTAKWGEEGGYPQIYHRIRNRKYIFPQCNNAVKWRCWNGMHENASSNSYASWTSCCAFKSTSRVQLSPFQIKKNHCIQKAWKKPIFVQISIRPLCRVRPALWCRIRAKILTALARFPIFSKFPISHETCWKFELWGKSGRVRAKLLSQHSTQDKLWSKLTKLPYKAPESSYTQGVLIFSTRLQSNHGHLWSHGCAKLFN